MGFQRRWYFNSRPSARGDRQAKSAGSPRGISIHAPPRGATSSSAQDAPEYDFNSRPSARGDDAGTGGGLLLQDDFNSRPSARGDKRTVKMAADGNLFQFTPLREGRLPPSARLSRSAYFNSRPSARGDVTITCERRYPLISIHAPPRGATLKAEYNPIENYISIHAPPRGATACAVLISAIAQISIHAPPRGATL